MKTKHSIGASLLVFLFCAFAHADVLILKDGKTYSGRVIRQDAEGVLFERDYAAVRYAQANIKEVRVEDQKTAKEAEATNCLPSWTRIVSVLTTNSWAQDLRQVPATVIETGVLRHVPYLSFRCSSGGYEINIYGDPEHPAGTEIGVQNYLVGHAPARSNCLQFMAAVLAKEPTGGHRLRGISATQKQVLDVEDVRFETTLPDEADAYGGWWISAYNERLLDQSRASNVELAEITQPKVESKKPQIGTVQPAAVTPRWTPAEIETSRPKVVSSPSSGSGGSVYVKGYYRKNGTYVKPHTRKSRH